LVIAYTRLNLLPAGYDGQKMTTMVVIGTFEVHLIEMARPSKTGHHSLRIDVFDRSPNGEFKRSSQHPEGGGCDEHSKAAVGSVWTREAACCFGTGARQANR